MTKNCQSIVNVFNVQIKQILDGYEFSWVLQNMAIDDQNGNSMMQTAGPLGRP